MLEESCVKKLTQNKSTLNGGRGGGADFPD